MTTSTDTPDTAPGIALQTLLRNAKASALREVIGPSIVDTLQGLDPELDSGTRLGELAASLVEPSEALRDAEMRDRIIRMLPLPKARELGGHLGAHLVERVIERSERDKHADRSAAHAHRHRLDGSPLAKACATQQRRSDP